MSHAHRWAVSNYMLLSLPTTEGFSERLTSWHCDCGAWCDITGEVRHGYPLRSPDYWSRLAARQQERGVPHLHQAWRTG